MNIKKTSLFNALLFVSAVAPLSALAAYDSSAKWHTDFREARNASLLANAQQEADSANAASAKALRIKAIALYKTTISEVPKDERYRDSVIYQIYRHLIDDQKSIGDVKGAKATDNIASDLFQTSTKEFPLFSSLPQTELNKTQRPSLEDMASGNVSKGPKSEKCPFCIKADAIVPIQYGLIRPTKHGSQPPPSHDPAKILNTALKKKHLGGCMIMPSTQHCNRCDIDFI